MRALDARLVPHLRPARRPLLLVLGGSLADGMLTVAQAFAVAALLVEVVTDPVGHGWQTAAWWVVAVVGLRALASYAVAAAAAAAGARVAVRLRHRVTVATTRLDGSSLSRHRIGELALLATRGVAAVEPYLTRYLPALILAVVLPAATLGAIFWLDWVSGLIVLCTLPLLPVYAVLIGASTRDRARRQWRQLGALAGHFLDVVRGLPTLVAYRRATAQSSIIRRVTDRYRTATADTLKLAFASSGVLELVATLSVALVAVSVGLRLAAGSLDFQVAMTVLLLAPEAYWPLRRVGAEFHAAAEGTASLSAIDAILDAVPSPATGATEPASGSIELDRLTVAYGGRTVIDALSTTFASPGLTAVVGPSGCGKSTLLATLIGEVEPSSGAIRVGGVDVLASDTWRRQVAWAPQRPWLTHGTVADNVRIGRPAASDEEIWQALERVDLGRTVAALPLGIDAPLGEDGSGLSAGQRARVALARVIIARRPYVFLDEPTAHLDADTEAVFLRTLRWLAEGSAVVVVAHRPAVAAAADRVLTLPALAVSHNGGSRRLSEPTHAAPSPDRRDVAGDPQDLARDGAAVPRRFGRRTGVLLGVLSVASGVALTATAAWLITRAAQHPPVLVLLVAIVAVRAFGLARPVLRYAERLVSHDAALRMLADRRADVYDALVPLVPGRLGVRRGEVLSSVVDDVDAYLDEQLRVRQPWWTAGLVGGGAVLFAAVVSPVAGVVTGLVLVAAGLGALVTRLSAGRAEADFVRARRALSARIEEVLGGARQLDLWQAAGAAAAAVDRDGWALAAAARRSVRGLALGRAAVSVACGLGVVGVAALVSGGTTSEAMLALLVMLPLALADALLPAVDAAGLSVRTREARARLESLTRLTPTVSDPASAEPTPEGTELEGLGVTAGWDDRDAVRRLSFSLDRGRRIGVVGPSGSGKSTVAALLLRFLDPRAGSLTLGGRDLRRLHLDDVRRTVGLVDDDPYVFSSTLAENIRFARPGATDAMVESVLRQARLGDWLDFLPDGLSTIVGEGHAQVSGGERARIGLARSLLADQPVVVLDEVTAHLDSGNAQGVTEDLLASSAGRSIVWITHGTIGLEGMDDVIDLGEARDLTSVTEPSTASR